ncbi:MAG: hypothetical protein N4A36_03580 [Candidatus Gracilibacteria bacterium]|jgi:hypothetical protein|nr:hypothetical protein [Candidatus Gracilibacteria bacterium]
MADFEQFGALESAQGQEKAGESQEQFRERQRQNQAAIAQIQQEEQQKKQDDNLLSFIIVKFLSQPQRTGHFLLISKLVAKNIPSDLIIAIIALVYDAAGDHIHAKFSHIEGLFDFDVKDNEMGLDNLGLMNAWLLNIQRVASVERVKLFETGFDKEGKIDSNLVELCVVCAEELFMKNNIREDLRLKFSEFFVQLFTVISKS